ncbi:MAG: alpha/beta hydrolase-fold protein [Planctomycetota bacterium]
MRLISLLALCVSLSAIGQVQIDLREDVAFEITQQTTLGQSVFLLGDIPALGNGDITRAVKLEPSGYPVWRATVSIPAGTEYTYRYYLRSDGPGQTSSPANGTPIGDEITASTELSSTGTTGKSLFALLPTTSDNATPPELHWRQSAGDYATTPMHRYGPSDLEGLTLWYAVGFGELDRLTDMFITRHTDDAAQRFPASGTVATEADAAVYLGGQLFTYVPAAADLGPARRDYNPASPPTIASSIIGEQRRYRVYLPRGYDDQPTRRYPVVYLHDGQNMFESGAFGSWNADEAFDSQTRMARTREVIAVAVDHTDRFRDFIPGLGADHYARFLRDELKPVIDASYRTLPDAANTGTLGSSLGGVISLYLGWEYSETFTRIGPFSGAWQVAGGFINTVATDPRRDIRIYLDSGDSGTSNDNYWGTYNVRDRLVAGSDPRYAIEGDVRHVVGYGDRHNEAAWERRLPGALRFLFPPNDEALELLVDLIGPQDDRNSDGVVDIDDLYLQVEDPIDLDLDGDIDQQDTDRLEAFVRRDERR